MRVRCRPLSLVQAVAEDRWPFKTAIPPLLQYPVSDRAFDFVSALVWMFYAPGWAGEPPPRGTPSCDASAGLGLREVPAAKLLHGTQPASMSNFAFQLSADREGQTACLHAAADAGNAKGLCNLISCFLPGGGKKAAAKAANGRKDE